MTTETSTTPGPGGVSPGRAACEAFWAAVGAGPGTQEPGAAWDWAFSQNTTRAWEAAAEAAGTTQEAELAMLRKGGRELGRITARLYRTLRAAAIEMHQNGANAGMQWVLNSIPPEVDEGDGLGWDGEETAQHWFDRATAAGEAAEAAAL